MLGFVIEVAVIVTVVGVSTPAGAVYKAEAVRVEESKACLVSVPKLSGERVQVTPCLLRSYTVASIIVDWPRVSDALADVSDIEIAG